MIDLGGLRSHAVPAQDTGLLHSFLRDSVYYPGSRFDGEPVKMFGAIWPNWVYVDYGVTEADLDAAPDFKGYALSSRRSLSPGDVVPAGWRPPSLPRASAPTRPAQGQSAFGQLLRFDRDPKLDDHHGPITINLMFLCADGVAAFDGLYRARQLMPRAVFIKDHGFGGNWTTFGDSAGPFWNTVTGAGNGPMPDCIVQYMRGGSVACWQEYSVLLTTYGAEASNGWRAWGRR